MGRPWLRIARRPFATVLRVAVSCCSQTTASKRREAGLHLPHGIIEVRIRSVDLREQFLDWRAVLDQFERALERCHDLLVRVDAQGLAEAGM